MRFNVTLVILASLSTVAFAQPIDYRCPATYTGDDGRPWPLVERSAGVWRVDEAVPFVFGQGRFWRLVCGYRDPDGSVAGAEEAAEIEATVHWVEWPHEDGRLILEGICGQGTAAAGVVLSRDRQAKARAARPASPANQRLAGEMLAAAEARAPLCPGAAGARVCALWEVEEIYQGGRRWRCTWRQGASETPDPSDIFRWVYRSECRRGAFLTTGTVTRVAEGRFERSLRDRHDRVIRYVYRGEFESGGRVSGDFHRISPHGTRGPDTPFEAHCLGEQRLDEQGRDE